MGFLAFVKNPFELAITGGFSLIALISGSLTLQTACGCTGVGHHRTALKILFLLYVHKGYGVFNFLN